MDLFTLLTGSNLRIEIYYGFWIKKKKCDSSHNFQIPVLSGASR